MKKLLFVIFLGLLIGCEGQRQGEGINQTTSAALYKLAYMNGCIECHRVSAIVIGPSWETISDRYKDAPFAE